MYSPGNSNLYFLTTACVRDVCYCYHFCWYMTWRQLLAYSTLFVVAQQCLNEIRGKLISTCLAVQAMGTATEYLNTGELNLTVVV
jgi:hypothetical protein